MRRHWLPRSARSGFVVELVGDSGVLGHLAGVAEGGFGEDGIEAQGRKSLIRAGFVGGGEEILFGNREVVFRGRRRCWRGGCELPERAPGRSDFANEINGFPAD